METEKREIKHSHLELKDRRSAGYDSGYTDKVTGTIVEYQHTLARGEWVIAQRKLRSYA